MRSGNGGSGPVLAPIMVGRGPSGLILNILSFLYSFPFLKYLLRKDMEIMES